MKPILLISVSLNIVMLLDWSASPVPIAEGGSPALEGALVNGDVNCNSVVDISDAIFIINWLFLGTNDGPCPLADPPELTSCRQELTECEDELSDALGELASERQLGLECRDILACVQSDLAPVERFVDNGNGTVTDSCTGLMWQQTPSAETGLCFQLAVEYVRELRLGGHDDWRLPALREFLILADFSRRPAVPERFSVPFGFALWTSTVKDDGRLIVETNEPFAMQANTNPSSCPASGQRWFVLAVRG